MSDDPAPQDVEAVVEGLVAYNSRFVEGREEHRRRPLGVFARRDGRVVGGASGHSAWGWLFVQYLWVDESLRGTGTGSELLGRFERRGVERGCRAVWVDTFSFQARPFYEKLGYRQFGELADHPPGHRHHFLWKPLDGGDAG